MSSIPILTIQQAKGQPHQGVILQRNQVEELVDIETYRINIFKDISFQNDYFGTYYLANKCFFDVCDHSFNVFLGGDHYSSFGTILGSLKKYGDDLRIVWIDAHADIHSSSTSPSGNMHGMPVRFLMTHEFIDFPQLKPHQILYIGLRSVEQEEWDFIRSQDIQYITANAFLKYTDLAYDAIQCFVENYPLHISFDVDSLDPSIMKSTGTAEMGGLQLHHLYKIMENSVNLASSFCAMDIMEYNPMIGKDEEKQISKQTMQCIFEMIKQFVV